MATSQSLSLPIIVIMGNLRRFACDAFEDFPAEMGHAEPQPRWNRHQLLVLSAGYGFSEQDSLGLLAIETRKAGVRRWARVLEVNLPGRVSIGTT
jgi:hypothetical protein